MTKSLINTEDLHRAVDALVQGERIQITREDKTVEHKPVPSLWEQLEDAVPYSGSGGSAVAKSKPPITTGVVALLIEISDAATEGVNDLVGENRRNTPANLRAVAATLAGLNDLDLTAWWTEKLREWVRKARELLRLDPDRPRYARGTACPQCGNKSVATVVDGETVRTPALAINWAPPEQHTTRHAADTDWLVRAIECRACDATWFRGDSLSIFTDALLASQTQETMADPNG
jgi:hypothetical protein